MTFPAHVFRVLIASPSDVVEEREIAVKTIQEWNDLNAAERQLVLLPLRWETHSAPEYGARPQQVLNSQVVDRCDILVGVFWTRIGTPTGKAESGTIEEIERVASSGKPVMLYFSDAKLAPNDLDVEQLSKLREFKAKTFPKALVERYSTHLEFKDKLARQIEVELRRLLMDQPEGSVLGSPSSPKTDIVLHFADPRTGGDAGTELVLTTKYFELRDLSKLPDYPLETGLPTVAAVDSLPSQTLSLLTFSGGPNKDYYRQNATYYVLQNFFAPVRFWLKNEGTLGARDVHIDLTFQCNSDDLLFLPSGIIPTNPPSKTHGYNFGAETNPSSPGEIIGDGKGRWMEELDVEPLQPQRELSPANEIFVGAQKSTVVKVIARIYAETLSQPVVQELTLRLEVATVAADAREFLSQVDPELTERLPPHMRRVKSK